MEASSKTSGAELRDELRSDAQTISDTAKDRVHSEVDARKGPAAAQAKSLSSALETAAGELSDSPDWLRSGFERSAQTLQRFADQLEQKDSRQLTRDVQQLAREHPGMFLAGCAAAGFAAARVLKAGAEDGSTNGAGVSGDPSGQRASAYDPYAPQSSTASSPMFSGQSASQGGDMP